MYWIPIFLLGLSLFVFEFLKSRKWIRACVFTALSILIMGITIAIDYSAQTTDTEIWSGYVEDWNHKEEWDEYIPPKTTCTTDSKGKQSCTTEPGYWVHHDAENKLKTTDNGWFDIHYTPDGRRMNDSFPNHTSELEKMFPYKTPTASKHSYVNKVKASYSIYKHQEVDLEKFPDLPAYPNKVRDTLYIDRIVGSVPNKKEATNTLNQINSDLNKMVPDPDNPKKKKSYKQVNIIFVNVGEGKNKDYGFALQDKWGGGNKNDFVVAFSMDKKGNVAWAYPFSWSEEELLKIEVKQYMESLKDVSDFNPIVTDVSKKVEEKFVRKQFEDFNYLQIEVSTTAYVCIWIFTILIGIGYVLFALKSNTSMRSTLHRRQRPF